MGSLQLRAEFFDAYLELAVEFELPMRLSGTSTERYVGFPFRSLAAEEGVVFPDHFVLGSGVGSRSSIEHVVSNLRPGVTEVLVHPAVDTPELRAFAPDWEGRVDDHRLMTADERLRAAIDAAGIQLIGYEPLRDLQRAERTKQPA
jgi:hypothetical protein